MSTRCECGEINKEAAVFCNRCGKRLDSTLDSGTETSNQEGAWSKSYGIPGLYESTVSEGPEGAQVRTRFSLLGFEEVSRYPRWMITCMVWGFLALLLLLGLVVVSAALEADRMDLVAVGLGILGLALPIGYLAYRTYYRPPRK